MKEVWKFVRSLCLSFVVKFYTAFVLVMLWDWFVTRAFRLEEIGYWNMFGLLLFASLFSPRNFEMSYAHQWQRAMKMLEACIPEGIRAETIRVIDEDAPSNIMQWVVADVMKLVGSTVLLVIGWAIHTFLMS